MMKDKYGKLFSLGDEERPVPGCTISRELLKTNSGSVTLFSLAAGTDISPELYDTARLYLCLSGEIRLEWPKRNEDRTLEAGQALLTQDQTPFGIRALQDSVYLEFSLTEDRFNPALPRESVFDISKLVPVSAGRIVNMDVIGDPGMKFVLMGFDAGTGLAEHAAPHDALLFGLEGTGRITYEGKTTELKKQENFLFAGGGRHKVEALEPFKMALLMALESPAIDTEEQTDLSR